jgi:hypothetical protein
VDFGYKYSPPGGTSIQTISGWVWGDTNGNGVYEPGLGETPIDGVKVTFACGAYGTYVMTTATDIGSNYALSNVPTGTTCTITVDPTTLPSMAYYQTGDPDVSPLACSGAACDDKTTVTVNNANISDQNFGYNQLLGSISGTVCDATDGDGICQAGETGLTPVTVTLKGAGPDGIMGTLDDTTVTQQTGAGGTYSFANLVPGLYQVIETDLGGYVSVADRDGGNPNNISLVLDFGPDGLPNTADDRMVKAGQDFEDHAVATGFIGDYVWWDINNNGQQDAGEPGIPGVTVELVQSNVVIATTTTDANGLYNFTGLTDGAYEVRIQAAEFTTGNTLYTWTASPQHASGVPVNLDSDGDPTTHVAPVTLAGNVGTADIDFGFYIASSYKVTKTLTSQPISGLGEEITFDITIENTGDTWISVLPLEDTYDPNYLTEGFGSNFALPDTDDHINDGSLNWSDLTQTGPKGFGADLAPHTTWTVKIYFTARADTSGLTNQKTVNAVAVKNALIDPDGPTGPLGSLVSLPEQGSNAGVTILTPTGVTLESFDAMVDGNSVLVNWRSASESEILGYNVQRQAEGGEFVTVSPELIVAENAGQDRGASYTFRDMEVPPGAYTYRVEVVKLDGSNENYGAVNVTISQ